MFGLMISRRLGPLLAVQCLGAFADNMIKTALGVIALLTLAQDGRAAVPLAGAAIILPFLFFSATAGEVAAHFSKARSLVVVKLLEAVAMTAGGYAVMSASIPMMFVVLLALGTLATFISPLKYGIMPELLDPEELTQGNGLMESTLFLSILGGTLAGGALAASGDHAAIALLSIGCGVTGLFASLFIPPTLPANAGGRIGLNIINETLRLVRQARSQRAVWLAILGTSWFWTIGALLMAEFPEVGEHLAPGGVAISYLLAAFSVGVGVGSALCPKLIRGEPIARFSPFLLLAMSLFAFDAAFAAASVTPGAILHTQFAFWRLMGDVFLLAACGGLFSVPLYTMLQTLPPRADVANVIGANNAVNAVFMVSGALIAASLAMAGLSAVTIIRVVAVANLAAFVALIRLVPRDALHVLFRAYLRIFHRMEVRGMEHIANLDRPVVYVCNHQSYADGAILSAYLPRHPQFAVNAFIARKWWARPFMLLVDMFPVDPSRPHAINAMVKSLKAGRSLVIFPEGRLTRTGTIMKVYDGSAMVADKADVEIVPLRLDGLQLHPLSMMGKMLTLRWFVPVRLTILPPRKLSIDPGLTLRARRRVLGEALQDLMMDAQFQTRDIDRPLFRAVLDTADALTRKREAADDMDYKPLTYGRLILGSALLGRRLNRLCGGKHVGVMLPNSVGLLVTFMGLQAFARPPLMLNFSQGPGAMLATCRVAGVRSIVTSRRFVERGKLEATIAQLQAELNVIWLEDLRSQLGPIAKLRAMWDARFAHRLPGARVSAEETCVVLTTSGSTGIPKAVLLSHRNILASVMQTAAAIDFTPGDRCVNALPMFHSFGLTCGTILPLLIGIRTFFYPSPLHFRIVPEQIYDQEATIIFGTDTFLSGWARYAHPYDFRAVRYGFSGAEKVRDETRRMFAERFGVRILEAYGTTETAPGISANTGMRCIPGTVGRVFSGIETKLVPVPGIAEGGSLHVRGPNVMRGYIDPSKPGGIDAPEDGWYDTGDVVKFEPGGYVRILGRVKRFAKIGGERVSMDAAELLAAGLWTEAAHAVIAMPDPRKGEVMVLLTTQADAELATLLAHARALGIGEIAIPRHILRVPAIPVLATGKANYPAAREMAERLMAGVIKGPTEAEDDADASNAAA